MIINIDGETFDVGVSKVERKTRIEKESKGTTLDGKEHFEIIGTYIDYIVTFVTRNNNVSEYDRLYEIASTPVETHIVTLPYNQTNIIINATITIANTQIEQQYNGFRKWNAMKITFSSVEPKGA